MKAVLSKAIGFVGYIIQYGCVAHCTFEYLGDFVLCSGPSMEPTICSNDVIMTEHISPKFQNIKRGDIIIAKCPTNPNQNVCKRIVGVPGDKIRTGFTTSTIVPPGHVWLEGDNYNNSADSRSYGPVPQGLIRSRAIIKLWPLKDMTILVN